MIDASTKSQQAAMAALVRASTRMRRAAEAVVHCEGLTLQQFNVLRILRGAASAGEPPLPTMTIGERMVEPEPGITRLLGHLEAKGLVARARCPADGRCVRCRLTPGGHALLAALDGPMDAATARHFPGFTGADLADLTALLARVAPAPAPPLSQHPIPMPTLPHLLAPATLGEMRLANHVVMAPMTRSRAPGNLPNALMAEYYAQRAGAGLIVTEGTSPSPNGLGYARIPGLFTDAQAAAWRAVTDAVHARGGHIVVQLMHTGRVAHGHNLPEGAEIVAPSSAAAAGQMWTDQEGMQPHPAPREMTTAEVEAAVAEFGTAARLAVAAGFDGVEVHGANGYLVEQFLNPASNTRTDAYGGSVENRVRFAVEATRAVAAEIGAARTGIRLSPHGLNGDMAPYDGVAETYARLAGELAGLGVGYLHLVDHSAMGGAAVPAATVEAIRGGYEGTLLRTGGFTAEAAEEALARGDADLVGFGRPFIANPDLVERFATGADLATPDPATFYAPGPNGLADGYTTYPALAETAA